MRTQTLDESSGVGRTDFEGDYDRILFSQSFRRLHDKTQVFPMPKNDHVHTRLTHSLEVAAVGRSLGRVCGEYLIKKYSELEKHPASDFGDIVAAACMAHDIGNPPFGHAGEDAIKTWFDRDPLPRCLKRTLQEKHVDFVNFEGNAQGFRIITRLENHANKGGLQLTYSTLGAFLKYPQDARNCTARGTPARTEVSRKKHSANLSEAELLKEVCETLGLKKHTGTDNAWCRHPLAFLTEAADDICNGLLDIEDGVDLGHVPAQEAIGLIRELLGAPAKRDAGNEMPIGKLRAIAINHLIRKAKDAFCKHEDAIIAGEFEKPLMDSIDEGAVLDRIKALNQKYCYDHPLVLQKEIAGFEILGTLLQRLIEAQLESDTNPKLEKKIRKLFPKSIATDEAEKVAEVVDIVSGMTDHYAMELYQNLMGLRIPI